MSKRRNDLGNRIAKLKKSTLELSSKVKTIVNENEALQIKEAIIDQQLELIRVLKSTIKMHQGLLRERGKTIELLSQRIELYETTILTLDGELEQCEESKVELVDKTIGSCEKIKNMLKKYIEYNKTKKEVCSICSDRISKKMVKLNCDSKVGHRFCYNCISKYWVKCSISGRKLNCPNCRKEYTNSF